MLLEEKFGLKARLTKEPLSGLVFPFQVVNQRQEKSQLVNGLVKLAIII